MSRLIFLLIYLELTLLGELSNATTSLLDSNSLFTITLPTYPELPVTRCIISLSYF